MKNIRNYIENAIFFYRSILPRSARVYKLVKNYDILLQNRSFGVLKLNISLNLLLNLF